ncbi:MAG: hypothetical protein Q7T92_10500 [Lutibacter sp.]|nr:hypothetical protein [Lutibacter sp.]
MDNFQPVLAEITQLTNNIESNYPELYQFLDENPNTIPSEKRPIINMEVLRDYLESLRQLLKHHIETRKKIAK